MIYVLLVQVSILQNNNKIEDIRNEGLFKYSQKFDEQLISFTYNELIPQIHLLITD